MNKNTKTSVLLMVVVIVWGTIGYQLYLNYQPSQGETLAATKMHFVPKQHIIKNTYSITANYRDPFTGKKYKKPVVKKPTIKKQLPKPEIIFPRILFMGMIEGAKKTYIISINNTQEVFQLNDTFLNITLVAANEKSITIRYQNSTKNYTLVE
tara:strand:+ start:3515 stop:3973 length:459 start_codon:yes stop_codon:yes gene_type:complete